MHERFPDILKLASVKLDGDTVKKRWAGVESYCKTITVPQILDLVRLAFRRAPNGREFVSNFSTAFRSTDPTFAVVENEFELSVLAEACLLSLTNPEFKSPNARIASVGVLCASRSNVWQKHLQPLVEAASKYTSIHSRLVRDRNQQSVQYADELSWTPEIAALAKASEAFADGVESQLSALQSQLSVLAEELDVLWWIFGGFSRDLAVPMSDLGTASCIVAGKELGDLTSAFPGFSNARAFLSKILLSPPGSKLDSLELETAVNASPRGWREEVMNSLNVEELHGIAYVLVALKKSLETEGKKNWIPSFRKTSGYTGKMAIPTLDLAIHTYDEFLLIRAIEGAQGHGNV